VAVLWALSATAISAAGRDGVALATAAIIAIVLVTADALLTRVTRPRQPAT